MGQSLTGTVFRVGAAMAAGAVGVCVAGVAFMVLAIGTAEVHFDVGASLYLAKGSALLVGAAVALDLWPRIYRRARQQSGEGVIAFLLAASLTSAVALAHMAAGSNPSRFLHTWGELYVPWIAVQLGAGLFAAGQAMRISSRARAG